MSSIHFRHVSIERILTVLSIQLSNASFVVRLYIWLNIRCVYQIYRYNNYEHVMTLHIFRNCIIISEPKCVRGNTNR